jgi:hypothetical protein
MLKLFSLRILEHNTMTQTDQSNMQTAPEHLQELIQCAYDVLADGKVTFGEVVTLGGVLASKVTQFAQLSGLQKQALVVDVVERALQRVLSEKLAGIPEEELRDEFRKKVEAASSFAKETLPSVLKLAVQASRGELNLGKVVDVVTSGQGPLSCLQIVLPLLSCKQVQVTVPSKINSPVQLEMSKQAVPEPSKEPQTLPSEEESKSQEAREASTVAQ